MIEKQKKILRNIEAIVKEEFSDDSTGHDWWHAKRVRDMAIRIAKLEKKDVDMFLLEVASLVHDIEDWKLEEVHMKSRLGKVRIILERLGCDEDFSKKINAIVTNISFKGNGANVPDSLEGKIVQDADRLDALGAIGIARTFAYGGKKGQTLYNQDIKPHEYKNFEAFKKRKTTTLNHFYEKLLQVKDKLNTRSAKRIAQSRHQFLEDFLNRFYLEMAGKE